MTSIESSGAERMIGLECFFTPWSGISGRLRAEPEDFVVEELSLLPREEPGGANTAVVVRARYWETNRLVRELARRLHISRKKIMFAGTKDKRAVTTQLFVLGAPIEDVNALSISDVEMLRVYQTNARISMGDLLGNRFDIRLRDMDAGMDHALATCQQVKEQLDELGGFPNFFGVQRFGAVRPITHIVGRHMTKKEPEKAVMTYLCHQSAYEQEGAREARNRLAETGDMAGALHDFPDELSFEKAILNHLVVHPGDYVGALGQLPQNLQMMFVHAYQSYLFNRMLSERMRRCIPLNEPVEGDMVLKVDRHGLPDHENWVLADSRNIPRLTELMGRGKAFVSATLFGMDSEFAGGQQGDIEAKVIEEEGVDRLDFVLSEYRKLGSHGTRREILGPYRDFELSAEGDAMRFRFRLTKGCYATTLLREFMKAHELTKY